MDDVVRALRDLISAHEHLVLVDSSTLPEAGIAVFDTAPKGNPKRYASYTLSSPIARNRRATGRAVAGLYRVALSVVGQDPEEVRLILRYLTEALEEKWLRVEGHKPVIVLRSSSGTTDPNNAMKPTLYLHTDVWGFTLAS